LDGASISTDQYFNSVFIAKIEIIHVFEWNGSKASSIHVEEKRDFVRI